MKLQNVADVYPLSPIQDGLLFHSLQSREVDPYFQQFECTLVGALQLQPLRRAWERVIERHSILRTAFVWEGLEQPLQVVREHVRLPWEEYDWRRLSAGEQETELETLRRADRLRGFELADAPLMRLAVVRLVDERCRLIWSLHHLLLDGWSMPLVLQEVFAWYVAFQRGDELSLAPPRPYRDHIAWLLEHKPADAEAFWRRTLHGFSRPTPLGLAAPPEGCPVPADPFADEARALSEQHSRALEAYARTHRLTLNTVMSGAWALLLSHYSGEEDVVLGTTMSGRSAPLPGIESMVGVFINSLPVRVRVTRDEPVVAWLRALQAHLAEVRGYEATPLSAVQGWSDVVRGLPLFESLVVFDNYPIELSIGALDGGLTVTDVRFSSPNSLPLTLKVEPGPTLVLRGKYDRRRVEAGAVTRMLQHFENLLASLTATPDRMIRDVRLLSAAEHDHVLGVWGQGPAAPAEPACIHHLIAAQAARTPAATAVVVEGAQLTYGELEQRANRLARHLRRLGVGGDVPVGLALERSVELIIGLLGILKAGGAYVPVDLDAPAERSRAMLEDAGAAVLVTDQRLAQSLSCADLHAVCLDRDWQRIAEEPDNPLPAEGAADTLAYVLFTSGSTGRPKAVGVAHRALCNYVRAISAILDVPPQTSFASVSTIAADLGNTAIFPALCSGGCLHLISKERALDALALAQYVQRHAIDCLKIVPSHLIALLSTPEGLGVLPRKRLVLGGERLSWTLYENVRHAAPDCRIINHYGPTETTIGTLTYGPSPAGAQPASATVPIGRPIANSCIYVLDAGLQPVPVGVTGEAFIGGAGIARGYLNQAELTAAKFIPDPFHPFSGDCLYRTGDRVRYLPDGNVEFLGRVDDQVKIRGFRVELGEIEATIARHPAVQEVVVVVRGAAEGEQQVVAYVVAHPTQPLVLADLKAFVAATLPEHMIPAAFVALQALPLTPNGKVNRRALPDPEGVPTEARPPFEAPRDAIEQAVAQMWTDLFALDRVGIHDNFFDVGGHSLLALKLASRLREAFTLELPVRSVFEAPTVALMAAIIRWHQEQAPVNPAPTIARVSRAAHRVNRSVDADLVQTESPSA